MQGKRVLVAPLDWGYGHATRCIPVIRELLHQGATVIAGGTNLSRARILQTIPGLDELSLPGYGIRYSRLFPAWAMAIAGIPKILNAIRKENHILKTALARLDIDGIISDNRYGLYHEKIPSVLITHQINLAIPAGLGFVTQTINQMMHKKLQPFSEVWVPDISPDEHFLSFGTVSGALSFPPPKGLNIRYTGLLSRFQSALPATSVVYDLAVVASGPSPQKEAFLGQAKSFVKKNRLNAVWLLPDESGLPVLNDLNQPVVIASSDADFLSIIRQSAQILSRSGYSSISDWLVLNRGAILVPTPGQTEQEYLAAHLSVHPGFSEIRQNRLSSAEITLPEPVKYQQLGHPLKKVVQSFLEKI
jgi:hypothetical protein